MLPQQAYHTEVKRIIAAGKEYLCPIPLANAQMLAATKFWPDYCPHCGEKNTAHHAECPTKDL